MSTITLIRRSLAKSLNLLGPDIDLSLLLCGEVKSKMTRERQVRFQISKLDGSNKLDITGVTTQKIGHLNPVLSDPKDFKHIAKVVFTESYPCRARRISVLIGEPVYSRLITGPPILGPILTPACQPTLWGNSICGSDPKQSSKLSTFKVAADECSLSSIAKSLETFSSIECIGISPNENHQQMSAEDLRAIQRFEETAKFDPVDKCWTVPLPWKDPITKCSGILSSNYARCAAIMRSVEARVEDNDKAQVNDAYNEFTTRGWAQEIDPNAELSENPVYYLVTRPVIDMSRQTTKVRIVFDAGQRDPVSKKSLNDLLYKGPKIMPDIASVLLRFRIGRFVFTTDISKMYLSVRVPPEDADCLRYLWRAFQTDASPQAFRVMCHTFGLISSGFISSACVRKTAANNEADYPEIVPQLKRQMYVDDVAISLNQLDLALKMILEMKKLFSSGGFCSHKYNSNNKQILDQIPPSDREDKEITKVLGVLWDTKKDLLGLSIDSDKIINDNYVITKRNIMKISASIFDILGMIQPYTLLFKLILQRCWSLKLEYDTELPPDLKQKFIEWRHEIALVNKVSIPRWIRYSAGTLKLFCFGDASQSAYGSCIYAVTNTDNENSSFLLMSKSRLPPKSLKPDEIGDNDDISIVRLELLACVLTANLANYVRTALTVELKDVYFFTDSLCNLLRIQGQSEKWKPWVKNRIDSIHKLSIVANWNFVPGVENPSDICSRGAPISSLLGNKNWFNGPDFITRDKSEWPNQPTRRKSTAEAKSDESEIKKENSIEIYSSYLISTTENSPIQKITNHFERFSKVTRVLAKLRNLVLHLKSRLTNKRSKPPKLSVEDIKSSERLVIRHAQLDAFAVEIAHLEKGESVPKQSPLKNLDPILVDGILCHRSRLRDSPEAPFLNGTPIILPKNNTVTDKIISEYHTANLHAGTETVLCMLRRRFWIMGSRRYVRKVLHSCKTPLCRPISNLKLKMAKLPESRFSAPVAFRNCALDFFGPMTVTDKCGLKHCPHQIAKHYCLIVSCYSSRAIHLEMTSDLSTEIFLLAFRRFVGRRGCPSTLYSDNAQTFKKGANELKVAVKKINFDEAEAKLKSKLQIQWTWAKSKAPNTNGLTERLISNVKVALRKALFNRSLTSEELHTVLTECEQLVNNRPLGICEDSHLPVTPAELVCGRPLHVLSDPLRSLPENPSFQHQWRARKATLQAFWHNWRNNYLLSLSPLKKWGKSDEKQIKVGDTVLLRESETERNTWKIAKIVELHQNSARQVTSCDILLAGKKRPVNRSVRHLALLESCMSVKGPPSTNKKDHMTEIIEGP